MPPSTRPSGSRRSTARLFGSFVEHMGRCVYTGIYEPGHPTADQTASAGRPGTDPRARGAGHPLSRRELRVRLPLGGRRRPGRGAAARGWTWPGGPSRPTSSAWTSSCAWTQRAGVGADDGGEPRHPRRPEAGDLLVEYCQPSRRHVLVGSAPRRTARPSRTTSRVWCLGNEMDGAWQIGHKTADEYGRLAAETAKAMRLVDPGIELVACGSSNSQMPTFGCVGGDGPGAHATTHVDYISLHAYYERARRRPRQLPGLRGRHGPLHRRRGGHRGSRLGPREVPQEAQPVLRRVERLAARAASPADTNWTGSRRRG